MSTYSKCIITFFLGINIAGLGMRIGENKTKGIIVDLIFVLLLCVSFYNDVMRGS